EQPAHQLPDPHLRRRSIDPRRVSREPLPARRRWREGTGRAADRRTRTRDRECGDRKSTRLNSSHVSISYAVFCLKKKKKNDDENALQQDYEEWLDRLALHEPTSHYPHNLTGQDNSAEHMNRHILRRDVAVAVILR